MNREESEQIGFFENLFILFLGLFEIIVVVVIKVFVFSIFIAALIFVVPIKAIILKISRMLVERRNEQEEKNKTQLP